jgi:2-methylcitrate dehydratase PrpD
MNKSFNPGRAAENGLFAALLASQNFTSSQGMLEAPRGWGHTISTKQDWNEVTEGLGSRFESALNTYKPYACGIVIHPAIEAAIRLRQPGRIQPEDIMRIDLKVHPLVIELTNKKTPQLGLEGKFSVYHSVAVAWIEGAAGERQYSDRAVRDPRVIALRDKVRAVIDPNIRADQVDMTVTLKDGRQLHQFIERAIGSVEVPMSQAQLEAKFSDLSADILPAGQTRQLIDLCWQLEKLDDVCAITRMARPMTASNS